VAQWAAILRLAHIWEFGEIKALAFRELENIDVEPVTRIHLYHKHNIDSRLLNDAFEELARRPNALTEDEGQLLGVKNVVRLAHARELARSNDGGLTPSPPTASASDLRAILIRVGLSPLRTHMNGTLSTDVPSAAGPRSAPPLSQHTYRAFENSFRGGSVLFVFPSRVAARSSISQMTVPQTPLETIPETPNTTATTTDSPPSYEKLPNGRQTYNGIGKIGMPTWNSVRSECLLSHFNLEMIDCFGVGSGKRI
jgi:hypothetical protein